VRAAPMAGQVRLMTHADLTDADITAALQRIGPVDGNTTAGRTDGRRSPVRPGRR
jgi:threonine aldolase